MGRVKYPTHIVDSNGHWGVIFQGHGIDPEVVRAELVTRMGEPPAGETIRISEVFYGWVPRVKNCANYLDGFGCDDDGEWHAHWYRVRPTEDPTRHYTEAYWAAAEVPAA